MSDLNFALHEYTPADEREAAHRAAILALIAQAENPFDRRLFVPGHLTASAFVVSRGEENEEETGKALLIFHRKLGRWLQPGGHVEAEDGGDAHAAARREAREETGLEVAASGGLFDLDVHAIPARGDEPEHRHFDLRYLLFVAGLPASPNAELETRWFSWDELLGLNPDAGMRRMAEKARARGLLR